MKTHAFPEPHCLGLSGGKDTTIKMNCTMFCEIFSGWVQNSWGKQIP